MNLESDLRDVFMAEAEACHRPASQMPRGRLREFSQCQRAAMEYEAVEYGVRLPRTEGRGA